MEICKCNTSTESKFTKHNRERCQTDLSHSNRFKTLESIILNMVNENIEENINRNQFGGMGGASTTDAHVEMIHRWSEATDKLDHYVRVAQLDFSSKPSILSTIIHYL